MMFLNDRKPGRLAATLATTVVLLGAGACSGSGTNSASNNSAAPSKKTTTTVGAPAPFTEAAFTGSDEEFYLPPDPLPNGKPGELIRVQELGESDGTATVKVMYHSRDAADRDRAVTGLVTYPTTEAPADGWPVAATAPGTTGLAPRCGLSRANGEAPDWGVEGVAVMTDYIGLGTTGGPLHPYFSKPSEGHSVIDGVRAARQLADAHAGDRWLSIGHSQGGHGALSASELAADYAPELELVATLSMAPAAMFENVYGGIDPIVTGILTAMSLYGGAGEHPEIKLDDYVTDELDEASDVFTTGCLPEITDTLIPLAANDKLFTDDPRTTDKPAHALLLANDVGKVKVDAPLFLVSGTADDRVMIDRVRDLYARLCETGQVTELLIVDGATHDNVIPQASKQTSAWLNARLAGDPPTDSCATSPTAPG
jgi:pimeloyl-ACP methyl ester carboxylesterase